jgi:hypothetical protein
MSVDDQDVGRADPAQPVQIAQAIYTRGRVKLQLIGQCKTPADRN